MLFRSRPERHEVGVRGEEALDVVLVEAELPGDHLLAGRSGEPVLDVRAPVAAAPERERLDAVFGPGELGDEGGLLRIFYQMGVANELFPLLIFVAIGAMTDFGPLLENPRILLFGAAGQFGIFLVLMLALALDFPVLEAVSIAIIGASTNETSISGQPLRLMLDAGYAGKLYPVNPRRDDVQGVKAYPSAADIPEKVDCALIAVSALLKPSASYFPAPEIAIF